MKPDRHLDALLILLVVFVWLYLLVQSVAREERRSYAVDNTGEVVEVYRRGTVWELGKGTRPATDEEDGYAREREDRR